MSKELAFLIDQICRDKGVPRDVLVEAIKSALLSVAKKKYAGKENLHLEFDERTFKMDLFEVRTVVEGEPVAIPPDPEKEDDIGLPLDHQISLAKAREISAGAKPGDEVFLPLVFQDLGRIAAQTAKQVIFQRVREAERDVIYNEFKGKIGQVVTGTVTRREKGFYFINIGKAEALLAQRDALPGESLKRGDIVKAYIEDMRITSKGPTIILTRTDSRFVAELFAMEVPEIGEGLVKIKDVVREPGERTKIAVYSTNPAVDPVGACVGMKGTRVQSIVRELKGERIDIIPWSDDLRMLIARALSPAQIDRVGIVEEEKSAMVVVGDQNLALAIGKRGQNVRLAMKLTGWHIEIMSETDYSKVKMKEADQAFGDALRDASTDGTNEAAEELADAPDTAAAPAEGAPVDTPAEDSAAAAPAEEAAPAEDEESA